MTRLLALDPGGTTGWSYWEYTPTEALSLLDRGQIQGGIDGFVQWWGRPYGPQHLGMVDEIVAESFVNDNRTVHPDLTPKEIEGALKMAWGGPLIFQRNSYKLHADDVMLKRSGLWFRGQEHARDSARHALALQKVRRHIPTIERYWPRIAD